MPTTVLALGMLQAAYHMCWVSVGLSGTVVSLCPSREVGAAARGRVRTCAMRRRVMCSWLRAPPSLVAACAARGRGRRSTLTHSAGTCARRAARAQFNVMKDGMLFVEHIDIDVISSYVIENNVEYLWQYLRCNAGAGADEGVKSHDAALITCGARLLTTPPDPSKTLVVMADIARDVFKVFQAHDYGETITLTLSAACAVALAGHFLVSEVEPQPPSPARGLILYLGDDAAAGARVAAQRAAQAPLSHEDTVWNMLKVMRASLTRDARDAASAARGAEGLTSRAGDERGAHAPAGAAAAGAGV